MLKLVKSPNPILSTPGKRIDKFDAELVNLVNEMEKVFKAQTGIIAVGLAAPQVGKNVSLFIMKPSPKARFEIFVNPQILRNRNPLGLANSQVSKSAKKKNKSKLEGCLSIPHIWGHVKRAEKVYLEYQNTTGAVLRKSFGGFKAVIIQHEVDHLQGILFTQRVLEQNGKLYEEKEGKLEKLSLVA